MSTNRESEERNFPPFRWPTTDGQKRLGRFRLDDWLINNRFAEVRQLMSKLIVVRAEHLYAGLGVEYLAFCDDFEVVRPDAQEPYYQVDWQGENGWVFKRAGY